MSPSEIQKEHLRENARALGLSSPDIQPMLNAVKKSAGRPVDVPTLPADLLAAAAAGAASPAAGGSGSKESKNKQARKDSIDGEFSSGMQHLLARREKELRRGQQQMQQTVPRCARVPRLQIFLNDAIEGPDLSDWMQTSLLNANDPALRPELGEVGGGPGLNADD